MQQAPRGDSCWEREDGALWTQGLQWSVGQGGLGGHGTREIFVPSECSQIRSQDNYDKSHGKVEKIENGFVEKYMSENNGIR